MNKRGFVLDWASAVVTFIFLLIVMFLVRGNVGLTASTEFNVDGVTRFQGCDVTLLNLMQAPYNERYDFAEAIAADEDVDDINIAAEKYLSLVYGPDLVELKSGGCDGLCFEQELCCSQVIPDKTGGCMGVELVVKDE